MANLNHPRPGIMNHQPPGPTCFISCVVAVKEFYAKALMPNQGPLSPVQAMYENFTKYHAAATTPANHLKHALNLEGHYDGETDVGAATDEMQIFRNVITLKISIGKPLLCGVRRIGAPYGHVFMIYGYTLPNIVAVADPAFGQLNVPVAQIKAGYNGNPHYQWTKLFFTKP